MAQGVVQAIRNARREDDMFLTGVGGSQGAMEQIKHQLVVPAAVVTKDNVDKYEQYAFN